MPFLPYGIAYSKVGLGLGMAAKYTRQARQNQKKERKMKKLIFALIVACFLSACPIVNAKDPGYLGGPSSYTHRTDPPGPAYTNAPVGK